MAVFDDYVKTISEPQKSALVRVHTIIQHAAPGAEEAISYGMPAFKYKGKYLIALCAFKNHMSIFPGAEPVATIKKQLKDYKLSKGTIQFTVDHPLPEKIIKEVVISCLKRVEDSIRA